jgi:serine phosphatase RsbU (regulator of sigma subunit)
MSRRLRLAIGLGITAALLIFVSVYTWRCVREANRAGWAGVAFMPAVGPQQPQPGMMRELLRPGRVLFAFDGAPASEAGIEPGDIIKSINGICVCEPAKIAALAARSRTGDTLVYDYTRAGKPGRAVVRLSSPYREFGNLAALVTTIPIADLFLAIGLVVFCRKPEDPRAVVFFAMAVAGSMSLLTTVTQTVDASGGRGFGAVSNASQGGATALLFLVALASLPLILHLALIFPKPRPVVRDYPHLLRWIYVMPGLCGLLMVVLLLLPGTASSPSGDLPPGAKSIVHFALRALPLAALAVLLAIAWKLRKQGWRWRDGGWTRFVFAHPGMAIIGSGAAGLGMGAAGIELARRIHQPYLGGFAAGLATSAPFLLLALYPPATLVALYRSYREANAEEKRQVRWPLWGTIVAIAIKCLFGVGGFVMGMMAVIRPTSTAHLGRLLPLIQVIPRVAYLLVPLSFAFAILKYRLMNIDIIIRKTVVYTLLSGLILIVYLGLVAGLGSMLMSATGVESRTMVVASTLAVALAFVPLRNKLQKVVDRTLFRQRYDYPQALRAIAADMASSGELPLFLHASAERIQHALQNRAVILFVRRNAEFVASAKVGASDAILGAMRFDAAGSLTPHLVRPFDPRRRALDEVDAARLRRLGTTLIVPIIVSSGAQSNVYGFLALAAKLSDRDFDIEDGEFLSAAADQIAVTMERIRLQQEDGEFEQARVMQQTLLPREIPQIEGFGIAGTWQPARVVGGDYFDLLPLSGDRLAVCIGDVAGKGMPAALLMSSLQAAVRATAFDSRSPAELCERVRRVVVSNLVGGRFVTFFYGTLHAHTRQFVYCNAGHNPPIVVRAGGSVERAAEGGAVFSRLFRDTTFIEGELTVASGDRIVLFTDGITEARNRAGEDFGEPRLGELIAANRTLDAVALQNVILDAVRDFSDGDLEDDATMVVIAVG